MEVDLSMVVEERVDQQVKLNRWERLTMVLLQQLATVPTLWVGK